MPTLTVTDLSVSHSSLPLKANLSATASSSSSTQSNPEATAAALTSLYNRATRAFLHKDVALAHSLFDSAFSVLKSPTTADSDAFISHRKKWDLLRITYETTVYASPPQGKGSDQLPQSLRDTLLQSPQSLVSSMYSRSLGFFTPATVHKPNAAFLPSQILVTLVLSTLKLKCPQLGRSMIEDWLAHRGADVFDGNAQVHDGQDGYEKVIDMYCLHVLPKLEEWDYAKEFLEYENELVPQIKERMLASLDTIHARTNASRQPSSHGIIHLPKPSNIISPSPSTSRPISPASSSSSLSTTSTHTAVPSTPRMNGVAVVPLRTVSRPSSPVSVLSDRTVTKKSSARPPLSSNGSSRPPSSPRGLRASRASSLAPEVSVTSSPAPSPLAVIRASLSPYLSIPKLTTFLLFILIPLISFVVRLRRRRKPITGKAPLPSAAELARRRLAAGANGSGLENIWREAVRAVVDAVKMAGRGLV